MKEILEAVAILLVTVATGVALFILLAILVPSETSAAKNAVVPING